MFNKKTIHDIDINGKTVLLRADYNVPIGPGGIITDDYRIKQSLPTLKFLIERNCRIIICAHLGRPKSPDDTSVSLEPVAHRLSELLGQEVAFADDCIGTIAREAKANLQNGQLLLLQNLRYHEQEELNDENFARELAENVDIFVQDGFGVVHRAHASTEAITHFLPSVAGLLLEKEVGTIDRAMHDTEHPLMSIIGGAKIADKIDILEKFVEICDYVAIVGAMANTFLLAEGIEVGASLIEEEDVEEARRIIAKAAAKTKSQPFTFLLPRDVVVSNGLDAKYATRVVDLTAHNFADIEAYPQKPSYDSYTVGKDELILDIGPMSSAAISGAIQLSRTLIWNGTAGVTETKGLSGAADPYEHGSRNILKALEGAHHDDKNRPFAVVGGGDTVGYVMSHAVIDIETGMPVSLGHVSTGGGASLELMSGKKLPGVEALQDK